LETAQQLKVATFVYLTFYHGVLSVNSISLFD